METPQFGHGVLSGDGIFPTKKTMVPAEGTVTEGAAAVATPADDVTRMFPAVGLADGLAPRTVRKATMKWRHPAGFGHTTPALLSPATRRRK